MTSKPIRFRHLAASDVEAAIDYYSSKAGQTVALAFIHRLQTAYRAISGQPALGSLRYSFALGLPGLRSWPMKRFPYIVFYFDTPTHIDVWRILHAQRDVANLLDQPGVAKNK